MQRKVLPLCIALLASGLAEASGYHFGTQSSSNEGVANSGAADVFDASTIFYNPAGLSFLPDGKHLSAVGTLVMLKGSFQNRGSSISGPGAENFATGQTPQASTGNGGAGTFVGNQFVPDFYYAQRLSAMTSFGLGVFVPFGSKVDYGPNWAGRYNIVSSELKTVAINPELSWKLNDALAFGAGVSAQWISGTLSRRVNMGEAGIGALDQAVKSGYITDANQIAAANANMMKMFGNSANDGDVTINGEDVGFGFNFGGMWQIARGTRMGLAYRSAIHHRLQGTANWSVPNEGAAVQQGLTSAGVNAGTAGAVGQGAQSQLNSTYVNSAASLRVVTPESASINIASQITSRWTLLADITRTGHSRFDELRVQFASSVQDSVTVENWHDTTRYSIGSTYKLNDSWLLRAGTAIDQTPISSPNNRTPAIPDNTRIWYSMGFNYDINRWSDLDFAFTYVHILNSSINNTDNGGGQPCACSYATLVGNYEVSSYVASMQYNINF